MKTTRFASRTRQFLFSLIILIAAANGSRAEISGASYDSLRAAQDVDAQRFLEELYPEDSGYVILGPLEPLHALSDILDPLIHSLRVICVDPEQLEACALKLLGDGNLQVEKFTFDLEDVRKRQPPGYRGGIYKVTGPVGSFWCQFLTVNENRWMRWALGTVLNPRLSVHRLTLAKYAIAISDYLYAVDTGAVMAEAPAATDFGLKEKIDFYAPAPDYVISGYQNYKDFLYSHRAVSLEFAHGILAFIPTDSILTWFITAAPKAAFPNKEAAHLQNEYRTFFKRGGDHQVMHTLTKAVFDTLGPGEYFFAVGLTGKIRFGKELLREEVERIEKETGLKVPRANHAFLFEGDPVLTAGAFFIGDTAPHRIIEINAQSGHYFYSNIQPSIKEDIAKRSDYYFTTLGHLFRALDSLSIPLDSVLLRKF